MRFTEAGGAATWFGTYTAFNGQTILPMLMETPDFRSFFIHTLNGACVQNKGMALFPRRIGGCYAMCSRINGHNLYLMFSDRVHFWEKAESCAAALRVGMAAHRQLRLSAETPEGWLLITHGVGPMRRYSIGAMLLDGRTLSASRPAQGAAHNGGGAGLAGICPQRRLFVRIPHPQERLYLPYAVSDSSTRIAIVRLPSSSSGSSRRSLNPRAAVPRVLLTASA